MNISLRPLTLDDANEKYLSWLNDPIVTKHLETKSSTMEELKKYISDRLDKPDCRLLGVFVDPGDIFIGTVKFVHLGSKEGTEFGMMLGDRDYWGKGLGTATTREAVRFAFNKLNESRVHLGVLVENEPAIRAYRRVGFKDIGTRTVTRKDGSEHPAIDMAITKEEFEDSE